MKNIGLIGCGNIAETYFRAQEYFKNINIDKSRSYMDSISVEKIYSTLQKNNYCE